MSLSSCAPWSVLRAILLLIALVHAQSPSEEEFTPEDTITRDVCILGGGATGAYAAIRLKDMNKSIVVVERNEQLGGHAETLYVENGGHVDYGVQGVFNYNVSRDFFNRLGVQWKPLTPGSLINKYVNFKTGHEVPPPAGIVDTVAALLVYRSAIQKFDYLKDGVYNLPDPVPEELLWPFSQFVEKYKFEGALSVIYTFANALGDMLATPTLYVIQSFGISHIDIFLQGGYITPNNGMYEVYRKASEVLDRDVLYNSEATHTRRSDTEVQIITQDKSGKKTLIKAKKLLITIPPIRENLRGFDLVPEETSLVTKLFWKTYYVAVLKNTGIPNDINVQNVDPNENPGNLPRAPFQWALQDMGPNNYLASKIVGDMNFTDSQARDLIIGDLRRMATAGTFAIREDWELAVFGSHVPTSLMVGVEDIRDGFYGRVYGLQGQRATFWTGLTLVSDYSALLWQYTDSVVGKMFGGE
ncbi:FAD dependent oxidoreductase [Aspergillus bombycis]|uniref:FAD dependent oxidoreductase n=1 Tax=Aspergillus bombycis TaxID=109264 RepID=A0A1F8A9M8_9EURO|nr:FAD dependent oxidoreductase [Aspergillus bombycis]OGM48436.1 FAD dependent oxidoreductase [Aspergillus bombycis]